MRTGSRPFGQQARRRWSVVGLLLTVAFAASLSAEEPRSIALSAGAFAFTEEASSLEAGVEYRTPIGVWGMAVALGLYGTEESSFWGFAGLRRDFSLAGGWLITPGFAVALYDEGDGKDLGGPLEFRTALELGYEWGGRSRLALAAYHLSNAGLDEPNPGSNSLVLTYSFYLN